MTACLEVRTKIVLFVEGRSTHSSRREENPYGAQVFRYETGQQERSERCWKRGKRRCFLDMKMIKLPIVKEGREEYWNRHVKWDGALGVGTGTLPRLVFCCKVFQVFSAEPPSSGKATSQNVVSMCAHTSDTHLWFPRAPTLQVIVSVPPERAWRKVCLKFAFCPVN